MLVPAEEKKKKNQPNKQTNPTFLHDGVTVRLSGAWSSLTDSVNAKDARCQERKTASVLTPKEVETISNFMGTFFLSIFIPIFTAYLDVWA